MPVYIRKNVIITPPSVAEDALDISSDFLSDPDQLKDELPQPFRMVNKTILRIIDEAWDIIASREQDRIAEASRIRPPQYQCGIELEEHGDASCMASSPDGSVVMLGLSGGLVCLDALNHDVLAHWQQSDVHITQIHVSIIQTDMYCVSTIDDVGICRLFAVAGGQVFTLQAVNEQQQGDKMLAGKCEVSKFSDYLGLYLETADGKEGVLEVYKLPKNQWIKELENIVGKTSNRQSQKDGNKPISPGPDSEIPIEYSHPTEGSGVNMTQDQEDQVSQTPVSAKSKDNKFSPLTAVLKVKPPEQVQGIPWSSALLLAKTIDTGDVVGTGLNHQISSLQLEQRQEIFRKLHSQHLAYLPKEEQSSPTQSQMQPTFHFLTAGRILSHGLDHATQEEASSVAVWWKGHYQLCHYVLGKTSKELEHKPDIVWPHSSTILCTTISADSHLIAVGLEGGMLVVWDKYTGMTRRVMQITAVSEIVSMFFLDPSVSPQNEQLNSLNMRTGALLFVQCQNGSLLLVNTALNDHAPVIDVSAELEDASDIYTNIKPIDGVPELVLTSRQNGKLFIHNILTGKVVCEVTFPNTHELVQPWEPIHTVAGHGQMLYIKSQLKNDSTPTGDEDQEEVVKPNSIFIFQLRSFPSLDQYSRKMGVESAYITHYNVSRRMDASLSLRLSEQADRKERMQERWSLMRSELDLMKRAQSVRKEQKRTVFTASTIEKSLPRDSQEMRQYFEELAR